jgi:LacI family transcriptional regulator
MADDRKRTTQRDVARQAGVSQATVSLVLGGAPVATTPEVAERVLEIARRLGYARNRSGHALRTRRTLTFAVVVPDICNPFFPSLLKGVQGVAEEAGYDVIAINTEGEAARERRVLQWGLEGRVDGVIGVFFALRAEEFKPLIEAGLGVVRVESTFKTSGELPLDNVYVDNRAAAKAAVRYLLDRGHRRIAMIAGPDGPRAERAAGYSIALAERGLAPDIVDGDAFNEVGGRDAALSILARAERPTAIFAANDLMAIGAMEALRLSGVKIPLEMAVVGFDDIFIARLVSPSLTTVSQFQDEIGATAARILLRRLRGGEKSGGTTLQMPYRLIERESA